MSRIALQAAPSIFQAARIERQIEDGQEVCRRKGRPLPDLEDSYVDNNVSYCNYFAVKKSSGGK